jgi:tRNA (guanosine-2'-O-)-methyltransferase
MVMTFMNSQLVNYLENFVNTGRIELLNKNLNLRTRYLTVVLEDIFQPHNTSAILRSCDCFGIQDIHIIENRNKFLPNKEIALGAEQWLSISRYNKETNNTGQTLQLLKDKGYRIIATSPHQRKVGIDDFDLNRGKSAIIFGTELTGVSDIVKEMADEFITIPMCGFTESLNISVSVALAMFNLCSRLRKSELDWQLTESDITDIKICWLRNSIKRCDLVEKRFKELYCE